MFARIWALIVCGAVLTACATPIRSYDGPDAGFAIATLAAKSGTEYSSYRLYLRSRDQQRQGEFVWLQNNMFSSDKPDFSEQYKSGEVNVIKLAPGDYELYSFSVFQNGYPATATYSPRELFSIPFTVRPQQAVYLGEYLAIATYGENFFGMTVKGGPIFVVSNQQTRDSAIAKAEAPEVSAIQTSVPNASALRPPLFTATPPGL